MKFSGALAVAVTMDIGNPLLLGTSVYLRRGNGYGSGHSRVDQQFDCVLSQLTNYVLPKVKGGEWGIM